jgi:hypothetical protein
VYYKLEKYWGKHVPILRSYGTTACGSVVYVAIEFINGSHLELVTLVTLTTSLCLLCIAFLCLNARNNVR